MPLPSPSSPSSLPSLTLHLFGPLRIHLGGEPLPRVRTRSVEWLLALLVLRHGRAVDRAWLAGTLWPDSGEGQGLNNLRNALVHLRKALGREGERIQSPARDTLLLDLEGAEVDVVRFDRAIRAGDAASLNEAVTLYAGPLLEGCYEAWVTREREEREQTCLSALETLADQAGECGDNAAAIRYLRRAQALDPLRDSVARHLMAALAATGDPGAAVEVYRELRNRLHTELAAAPDTETTRFFQEIRTRARETSRGVPSPPSVSSPDSVSASGRLPARPPQPLVPLVGREQEVDELREGLKQSRLVTLIGAGGVGKTRLAMEFAARAEEAFSGGVIWVELAPLAEGELILPTLAAALGLSQGGRGGGDPETLLRRLIVSFSEGPSLLVVDNCEHLLDAVAEVVGLLLSRCPDLRALATSRQRLGLTGEMVWRVPSLSVPSMEHLPADTKDAARLSLTFPAVRLFVERAASARRGFQLMHREQVVAVCQICRRLDGIPLALELAAARTNVLSVEQIASRLDDRFRLLTAGSPYDPPRHRTLRALIDWSHDQLSEAERVLLRRLSVFAGGWDLGAAEAVYREKGDVLDLLASLLDRSLIGMEEQPEGVRYRMLETVREYGRERLEESGEEETVRGWHAAHYLALAEQAKPFLLIPEPSWLDRLETEHDNLRAALTRFAAQEEQQPTDRIDRAMRLAAALSTFWNFRGHFYEQRAWLVSLARRSTPPTMARAVLLGEAAQILAHDRDFAGAQQTFTEMVEILRQLGDRKRISGALNGLAWLLSEPSIAGSAYDPVAARALAQESLAIARELGDRHEIAQSLFLLGGTVLRVGDRDEARAIWLECRSLDQERGVKGGLVLEYLGDLALERGDPAAARDFYSIFLAERHEIGERWGIRSGLQGLAAVALAQGEPERAARLRGASLTVRESFALPLSEADRASYEALQSDLREALGESTWDTVWAEGRAMALEQAVAYALRDGGAASHFIAQCPP